MNDQRPWYGRPAFLVLGALLVLAGGIAVGFFVNGSGDDEDPAVTTTTSTSTTTSTTTSTPTTTPTTVAPTTVAPTTVPVSDEDASAAGNQQACDRLTTPQLQTMCDGGNVDACQVLLARQGDDGAVEGG